VWLNLDQRSCDIAYGTAMENQMSSKTKTQDVTAKRGEKMRTGKAWRLLSPTGYAFKATLVKRLNIGKESVAVFRVIASPK
jgi:hypothetical protein